MKYRMLLATLIAGAVTAGQATSPLAPRAHAAPASEVEYVYDIVVRRHYSFPGNDSIACGHRICDKVTKGESFAQVMGGVRSDVTPSGEQVADYLGSYAVNPLCPEQIRQLRNSAAGYRPVG